MYSIVAHFSQVHFFNVIVLLTGTSYLTIRAEDKRIEFLALNEQTCEIQPRNFHVNSLLTLSALHLFTRKEKNCNNKHKKII